MQHEAFPTNAFNRAWDPESFRAQGHALIDMLANYLGSASQGGTMPILPWVDPAAMVESWPPIGEMPENTTFAALCERILREANHLHHPHYIGHQVPPPLPVTAMCDMIASLLNNGMAVYEMGTTGTAMETRLIQWMCARIGFGDGGGGVITSGGSAANLTALLAARNIYAERCGDQLPAMLVSEHAHYSVTRALKMLGFGTEGIIRVPVDDELRLDTARLDESLEHAKARDRVVIGVCASACSTPAGIFDRLEEVAAFCAEHRLWMHVDAAHGAPASLSEEYRHLLNGIEHADSVVWDIHKMMLMPALASAVLYKRDEQSYAPFAERSSYLLEKAGKEEWFNIGQRTLECTKRSIGFKAYIALQLFGEPMFASYLTCMFDRARAFADTIQESDDFELGAYPEANIVCFRYTGTKAGDIDALQIRLRKRLIESGAYYIVQTALPTGRYLRVVIINPLTTETHLARLLDTIREIARSL